jgi:hypothetical protein
VLNKFRRAWHSARALQLFAKQDVPGTLRCVEAMRSLRSLSAAERMWTYFPLVLAQRFDEAFDILDDVCRETGSSDDENDRFINLCARALRASSNGDAPLHDQLIRQAKNLKPRSSVRMWSQLDGPNDG